MNAFSEEPTLEPYYPIQHLTTLNAELLYVLYSSRLGKNTNRGTAEFVMKNAREASKIDKAPKYLSLIIFPEAPSNCRPCRLLTENC